jgi:predicted ATPase
VVAGAAGVGKTRLAAEVAARWRADDAQVRTLVATRSVRSVPLGVFAPLLHEPVSGAPGFDVLRKAADAVAQLAADRRLLLVIDDANLLDEASAAVTHQLRRCPSGSAPRDASHR